MECMAGKVAGDRRFEEMGGVVDRSITSQNSVRVSRYRGVGRCFKMGVLRTGLWPVLP